MTSTTTTGDDSMTTTQTPRVLHKQAIASKGAFVPVTSWEPLEQARERQERAAAELAAARRDESRVKDRHKAQRAQELQAAAGRVLDGEPSADPAASEDARRQELHAVGLRIRAAQLAARDGVIAALRLVEEHPEWAEEIAGRRAVALAEREELLARAEAAKVRAHSEDHMHRWLTQAAERPSPQPFRPPGPPPPPPQTLAQAFGVAS